MRHVQTVMLSLAGMEWYCYAALGVLTALMSFCMDLTIAKLLRGMWVLDYTHNTANTFRAMLDFVLKSENEFNILDV